MHRRRIFSGRRSSVIDENFLLIEQNSETIFREIMGKRKLLVDKKHFRKELSYKAFMIPEEKEIILVKKGVCDYFP